MVYASYIKGIYSPKRGEEEKKRKGEEKRSGEKGKGR